MRTKKSPKLKKIDSYDKDHRTQMENPHAFRKNWPKKKARENRRDRVALRSALADTDAEDLTSKAVGKLRDKTTIRKSSVSSLRESIVAKKRKRLHRLLAKVREPNPHKALTNDGPCGRELL